MDAWYQSPMSQSGQKAAAKGGSMGWPAIVGAIGSVIGGLGSAAGGFGSLFGKKSPLSGYGDYLYMQKGIRENFARELDYLEKTSGISRAAWMGSAPQAQAFVPQKMDRKWERAGEHFSRMGQDIMRGVQMKMAQSESRAKVDYYDSMTDLNNARARALINAPTQGVTKINEQGEWIDETDLGLYEARRRAATKQGSGGTVSAGNVPSEFVRRKIVAPGHADLQLINEQELTEALESGNLGTKARDIWMDMKHRWNTYNLSTEDAKWMLRNVYRGSPKGWHNYYDKKYGTFHSVESKYAMKFLWQPRYVVAD